MDIWLPSVQDEHDLKREPSNKEDTNAVAVVRESLHKSGENRLGSGQRETRHRELATEQRCSHPNEARDDIEVIEHVPKL